jgi:hypothetical protein
VASKEVEALLVEALGEEVHLEEEALQTEVALEAEEHLRCPLLTMQLKGKFVEI